MLLLKYFYGARVRDFELFLREHFLKNQNCSFLSLSNADGAFIDSTLRGQNYSTNLSIILGDPVPLRMNLGPNSQEFEDY